MQHMRGRCVVHQFQDQRSKVNVTQVVQNFWQFPLCSSIPISPIHFIRDTHTAHEVTMCSAPFPRSKVQTSRSHRSFEVFVVSALWLAPYLTKLVFWSKVNIWYVNCAHATAFILDTRTGVLVKVSKFLRQKMSWPEGDSNPQPSDSCQML